MRSIAAVAVAVAVLTTSAASQVRVLAGSPSVGAAQLRAVSELADAGIARLGRFFPGTPKREVRIVVHDTSASIGKDLLDSLHPGVPGFARLQRDEIHLVMHDIKFDPPNDLRTTVDHELVHILLDQYVGANGLSVPRWLHEGLAQDLAGSVFLGVHEEDLVYRVHSRTYIPFRDLEAHFPRGSEERLALAYGQSYSFVHFLRERIGLEVLLAAARECSPEVSFRSALASRTRRGLVNYEDEWLDYLLYESGASFRTLLSNCFFILLLVFGGPLLALAVAKRRNREERLKQRLGEADRLADASRDSSGRVRGASPGAGGIDPGDRRGHEEDVEVAGDDLAGDDLADGDLADGDLADGDLADDDGVDWDDWRVDPRDPDYQGPREPRR